MGELDEVVDMQNQVNRVERGRMRHSRTDGTRLEARGADDKSR